MNALLFFRCIHEFLSLHLLGRSRRHQRLVNCHIEQAVESLRLQLNLTDELRQALANFKCVLWDYALGLELHQLRQWLVLNVFIRRLESAVEIEFEPTLLALLLRSLD